MNSGNAAKVESPDPALIRSALRKMLDSPGFANSSRLAAFLTFIVDSKLSGRGDDLKETTIGIEVYGRTPGYDPRQEPIVRTEARRLRAKLEEYYQTAGVPDHVRILMPKGGYTPEFEVRPEPKPTLVPIDRDQVLPPRLGLTKRKPLVYSIVMAAGVMVAGILLVSLHFRPWRSPPAAPPRIHPLTSYRGSEIQPSLSPDGKRFAFVWDAGTGSFDIYLKSVDSGTPVRLTTGPGHDVLPAWSRDGRYLAFIRIAGAESSLWVIPSAGGAERKIATLSAAGTGQFGWVANPVEIARNPGPVWSADGQSVVLADSPVNGSPYALYAVNVDGSGRRKLTSPEPGSAGDMAPVVSPDGRSLAFVRTASIRGSNASIYILSDNRLRGIFSTDRNVSGLAWISDHELLFTGNQSGPNMLWRVSSQGGDPEAVVGAGRGMGFISYSRASGRLSYAETHRNDNVWRVALKPTQNHAKASGAREIFLSSSRGTDSPEFSPDGDSIAFVSNRTGSRQIFVARGNGDDPIQLSSVGPEVPIGTPRWSPDGRQIVYDTVRNGHSAIAIMNADGTHPHVLVSDDHDNMMPSWSHDGQRIYFTCKVGAEIGICQHPASGGVTTQLTGEGGGDPRESPDGRLVYFGASRGIWQVSRDGGAKGAVPGLSDVEHGRYWTVAGDAIYFVKSARKPWIVYRYDLASQSVAPVTTIEKPPTFGSPGLAVSPDLAYLLFGQVDEQGSDIVMVEGILPR